nr:DUF4332 domain-containing protein [Akkermansiaceae bacterium]
MRSLDTIADLQADERELLEAAGFVDTAHLAAADPHVLVRELAQANGMLRIVSEAPGLEKVTEWIDVANGRVVAKPPPPPKQVARKAAKGDKAPARKAAKKTAKKAAKKSTKKTAETEAPAEPEVRRPLTEMPVLGASLKVAETPSQEVSMATISESAAAEQEAPPEEIRGETQAETPPADPAALVNFEADPDVLDMLQRAPTAIPMPARLLAEKGIPPVAILEAPLLNRAAGDLEVRVTASVSAKKTRSTAATPRGKPGGLVHVADFRQSARRAIDISRVRQMDQPANVPEVPAAPVDERLKLLRTAREETNRGKDPGSRRYVRGVLHDRGLLVGVGSLIALLLAIDLPLAVGSAVLLLLSDLKPASFAWVPKGLLVFPLVFPILG